MIFGIGTDIVEVERIRQVYARHGERFLARLLSDDERARASRLRDPIPFLAKRWAAKEAFAKALGTGIRPPVSLRAISVGNDANGRPVFQLDRAVQHLLAVNGIDTVHLSLSDERQSALAFVVLECGVRSQV